MGVVFAVLIMVDSAFLGSGHECGAEPVFHSFDLHRVIKLGKNGQMTSMFEP